MKKKKNANKLIIWVFCCLIHTSPQWIHELFSQPFKHSFTSVWPLNSTVNAADWQLVGSKEKQKIRHWQFDKSFYTCESLVIERTMYSSRCQSVWPHWQLYVMLDMNPTSQKANNWQLPIKHITYDGYYVLITSWLMVIDSDNYLNALVTLAISVGCAKLLAIAAIDADWCW